MTPVVSETAVLTLCPVSLAVKKQLPSLRSTETARSNAKRQCFSEVVSLVSAIK